MGHGSIKEDPAIERFNTMRETSYLRFKWTPATVRTALLGFIVVPSAIYYFADKYHVRWDWVGRRRGQPLDTVAAKAQQSE
ncbi:hypothetical protein P691DRAFT_757500 [Macrolepiota fuliginosa MF-IS2]|uniref:NADH-ubiquinone oxidoreductase B15 subunit n=1 Tax=Macrolepiota fuliginosa MF-IS2 TaxID=1400762 RepID=A0A9P5XKH5_9AGAR|nr:hypothetical protein P691DRAFT_757500 [Macrolepiota fuliginosa MF-IS2]